MSVLEEEEAEESKGSGRCEVVEGALVVVRRERPYVVLDFFWIFEGGGEDI